MTTSSVGNATDYGGVQNVLKQAIDTGSFYKLNMLKIKLVDHCNLRCPKCGHWRPERRYTPDQLIPLSLQEWLRLAEQAVALGLCKVRFSGGEPTLHQDLPTITRCFSENSVHCGVTTNGTHITKDLASRLISAGMSQFAFSVDGPSSMLHDRHVGVQGAFERLQAGLKAVQAEIRQSEKPIQLAINTVVTRYNIRHLKEILTWGAEQGAVEIAFLKLHELHLKRKLGLTPELNNIYETDILPELIASGNRYGIRVVAVGYLTTAENSLETMPMEVIKTMPCFTAWTRAAIFPAGDVYVCCHVRHNLLHFGNIRDAPLDYLLKGSRSNEVRRICYSPANHIPECNDCDVDLLQRLILAQQLGYEAVPNEE